LAAFFELPPAASATNGRARDDREHHKNHHRNEPRATEAVTEVVGPKEAAAGDWIRLCHAHPRERSGHDAYLSGPQGETVIPADYVHKICG